MQAEGSLWRGLGMLVAGGGLRSAVLLLRKVGMPDCAQALAQAVAEAQLDCKQGSADAGGICIFTKQLCMPDVDACLAEAVLEADRWLVLQCIASCKLEQCQRSVFGYAWSVLSIHIIDMIRSAGGHLLCSALCQLCIQHIEVYACSVSPNLDVCGGFTTACGFAGYTENLFHHTGSTPVRRMSFSDKSRSNTAAQSEANPVAAESLQFVCNLMQQL